MPGMFERFDAYSRDQMMRDKEIETQDRLWREQQGMLARGAWERLMGLMRGEQPTREPLEQWMERRRAPGMLQQRIDGRMVPRRGPMRPRTPMNGGVRG